MKRLIIVGAGGLGREVETLARIDPAHGSAWSLGGFLDTRPGVLDGFATELRVLGDPSSFDPGRDDVFVVAIGDTRFKRKVIAPLRLKGAGFVSLVSNVRLSPRVRHGATVFADGAMVAVDVAIGDYAFVGSQAILGHDVVVGDFAHLGARCFIAGGARIGNGATIHPMASIAKDVRIGDDATVGLGAVVFHDVAPGATVVGNPARRIDTKGG
jgi:sugar O-acyltransferase (sialic acid O-acetyltransferase NeuD family)